MKYRLRVMSQFFMTTNNLDFLCILYSNDIPMLLCVVQHKNKEHFMNTDRKAASH